MLALIEELEKANCASQEAKLKVATATFKIAKARIGMAKDEKEMNEILSSFGGVACW